MKAVILAAGKGSRISSITKNLPKSLLPFKKTTILGHSLEILFKNNISEIIVVTGYKNHLIERYVEENWPGKVNFIFNSLYETTNVLYSFSLSLKFIEDEDILFLHADTVFENKILKQLIEINDQKRTVLPIDKHICGEEEMKVKIINNKLVEINKTMDASSAHGEFMGLAKISSSHIPFLKKEIDKIFKRNQFQAFFELALENLIKSKSIDISILDISSCKWCEIDFPDDYKYALKLFE